MLAGISAFHRRDILRVGGAGLLGLTLPKLLQAEEQAGQGRTGGRAKSVIFLFQWGGPSHVDTFDMKPQAPDGLSFTVQSDCQFGSGSAGVRAFAGDGEGAASFRADPNGASHDEQSQFCGLYSADWL